MQLKCPTCGTMIPAGQINVQELIAVCPACDHVFAFNREAVARKAKPHKIKTPERVRVQKDDHQLALSYRCVFSPGRKLGLVVITILAFMYVGMGVGAAHDGAPHGILMLLGFLALLMTYIVAVLVTTTTRITADAGEITVKSGPLPFFNKDDKTLNAGDIAQVAFEKTQEVFPPGMVTHNVYADLHDGERINVVRSLPREHARYLAATLDDYLRAAEGADYVFDDMGGDDALWSDSGDLADGEIDAMALESTPRKSAG